MTTPTNQKGGFLLDLLFGDGKRSSDSSNDYEPRLTKKAGQLRPNRNPLRAAITSEAAVMKNYEALAKVSKTYYNSYATHIQNLITLDDINGMSGLQNTFKNVIVNDVFRGSDTINKHNPMLLRNYIVTDITQPRFFRKEHMMRQIKYKLSTGFALKDTLLIQNYDVSVDNNKAIIKFVMVNGDKIEKQVPIDKDISIDMDKLTDTIRDVIGAIKKKVDYQIDVIDDYDFQDLLLDVPGVQVVDKETIIARKVKELKESVKIDKAILDLPDVRIPETVKKALKTHTSGIFKYKSLSKKNNNTAAGDRKPRPDGDGKGTAFGKDKLTKTGAKDDVELALLKDLAEKGATPELHADGDNKEPTTKPASGKKKSFKRVEQSVGTKKEMEFCRQFNENKAGCDDHKDRCNYSSKNNKCYKNTKAVPS